MDKISYNKFLNDILSENARLHDIPCFGSFELTPLCNLDCKMCYVHLSDPSVRARMLSGDQWIHLMEQAIRQGMVSAMLTGGEALTHPDFWEIYMYLIDQGVSVRLKTNGILLNADTIRRLTEYPPYITDVSLYGCDGESYSAVTGHDVFRTVSDNIRAAMKAGLHLRIMITPSRYMLPWVDRVMEYAKTFETSVLVNELLIEPNPETGRTKESFQLDMEENLRIQSRVEELFPKAPKFKDEEEELYGKLDTEQKTFSPKGLPCNGGRTCFAVCWDGSMLPCLMFPAQLVSADPQKIGFEKAWRTVNLGVKEYEVPQKCHTCAYNTRCHYCPSMHNRAAPLCDPEVCAWMIHQIDGGNKEI